MDAKDILGLPKTPFPAAQERRHRAPKDSQRKPDGISREVYALTGGVSHLLPVVEPSHQKRRPIAEKEKITWEWLPFTSSARSDNLQLHHWVRVVNGVAPTGDYSFAKLNKSVDILKYTDEEYEKHLTDPVWTKEETDQLFDLGERFDLRFVVIADRFQPSRSMEELKSRYYSVTRALLIARAPSFADVSGNPLVKEPYNATNEIERKRALSIVLSQTRHHERRDHEIVAEAKRIMETRRASKSVEDVEFSLNTSVTETAEKADDPTECVSPPSNNQPTSSTATPPTTTVDSAVTPASLQNLGVYLRAHVLEQMVQEASSTAGPRTIKRVEQTLQELGVHVKPKVPTKAVCAEHLELRKEILTLLNLQKQSQNRETEAAGNRERSYTEMLDTPKRSSRGDLDQPFVHDAGSVGGERTVKRDHKRKVPLRK